jgi:signal transduction histidine kinase
MRSEIEVALRDKNFNFDDAKKLLTSNLEETEKLEALANALLKLARHQDEVKKSFRNISLEEIVVESYEKIASLAEERKIEFETNFYSSRDSEKSKSFRQVSSNIAINGDKQSLVELFVILLDNAIKYSPKNSKVLINIRRDKNYAFVKIKDSGIGIKACDLPHIFDRFYRADHSRNKEKVSGYGLGLSIAKSIVDLHGGKIWADSKSGEGSEFFVKFSIAK